MVKVRSRLAKATAFVGSGILLLNTAGCCINRSSSSVVAYASEKQNISFAWWGNGDRNTYTMDGIDAFQALNENIEVECKYGNWNGYSKRQNIFMKSNEAPDVMQINYSWLSEYSADGDGFYDISTLPEVDLSNFKDIDLSYGMVNGKLNALPIALNSETMYYNMDIYDEYGIDEPKTWDDLFAAAKIMSADGIYPIGMGDKAAFFFFLAYFEQTTGRSACDDDGNLILTKDDIKYMLEFYKRLVDEKVMPAIDQYNLHNFHERQVAGTMGWVSDADNYCSTLVNGGYNVVVGDYPKAENMKKLGWYVKPATMYAISKNTEHPEAAAKLVNFLLNSKEMASLQKTEKGIPISTDAREALKEDNLLDGLVYEANVQMENSQEKMSVLYPVLEKDTVYIAFKDEATYYLYGKKTLDEVTDMIYNDFYGQ
jgi:oligogalacturonide transport system substrate-binding protein